MRATLSHSVAEVSCAEPSLSSAGLSAAPEQRLAPQKQRSQAEDFPALGKLASGSGRPPAPQPAASVSDSAKAANKVQLRYGRLPDIPIAQTAAPLFSRL